MIDVLLASHFFNPYLFAYSLEWGQQETTVDQGVQFFLQLTLLVHYRVLFSFSFSVLLPLNIKSGRGELPADEGDAAVLPPLRRLTAAQHGAAPRRRRQPAVHADPGPSVQPPVGHRLQRPEIHHRRSGPNGFPQRSLWSFIKDSLDLVLNAAIQFDWVSDLTEEPSPSFSKGFDHGATGWFLNAMEQFSFFFLTWTQRCCTYTRPTSSTCTFRSAAAIWTSTAASAARWAPFWPTSKPFGATASKTFWKSPSRTWRYALRYAQLGQVRKKTQAEVSEDTFQPIELR